MNSLASDFQTLCNSRWEKGSIDYGPTAFFGNNTFDMIAEELADIVNYCLMTYIKVKLLEERTNAGSTDSTASTFDKNTANRIQLGASAFTPE